MHSFPAHIRMEPSTGQELARQSVAEHCRNTAHYASCALTPIGLSNTAYLAGLIHDCGKCTTAYETYLTRAVHGEYVQRGSVNHTFAGVRYLFRTFHSPAGAPAPSDFACELIAYAAGAHHGLFDAVDCKRNSGFLHRMTAPDVADEEAIQNFLAQCADQEELQALFQKASQEVSAILSALSGTVAATNTDFSFHFGLLTRLLLSAVIEGDRRDTAEFLGGVPYPPDPADRRQMWTSCSTFMEEKLREFPADTPIQQARGTISRLCREQAAGPGGVYRLNVPTGAGKTLATLRYALAHSAAHDKHRILFVMPLLAIIEQNSGEIRKYLPDPSLVLEHHSNVVQDEEQPEKLSAQELLAETWDAPILITTLVQFLQTLFSGKSTSIRRFQALCRSVIVLDEVQTVPLRMLSLFNMAVNFLSQVCGATVVLCSATQPCLEETPHPLFQTPPDLVPYSPGLWAPFHRTELRNCGSLPLREIPDFIEREMRDYRSLLVVCNKKSQTETLYRILSSRSVAHCVHLSAAMCTAHRRDAMAEMQSALARAEPLLCISTQVIEAGVNLSFQKVIRLIAGMDSIIHTAGRCNRHGERADLAPVYILRCADEQLAHLQEIKRGQDATESLLADFARNPEAYQNRLTSDEAIRYYYRKLYRDLPAQYQDFYLPDIRTSIFDLLSTNSKWITQESCRSQVMQQAFKTAGQAFRVFDVDTTDVLVPYQAGRDVILALGSQRAKHDFHYVRRQLELARPYTVSLFQYQRKALEAAGALTPLCGGAVLALHPDFYHRHTGVTQEPHSEVTACSTLIL